MVVRSDIDNSSTILTVTVTREELKPKLDSELKKLRNRAPIKGFRAGQTPMDIVKKMYGPAVFSDALNELFYQHLYSYLRESKLDVLGQPLPAEDQQKFSFKINDPEPEYSVNYEVGFVPPFEIKGLDKDATFERLTVSNLDELAEEDLQYARKRMGKRTNPETEILEQDIVYFDLRELESEHGPIKEDGWQNESTIMVENVQNEQVKSQLLAAKKGDTLRFNARTLESHEKEEMYRKYILNLDENDDREVGDWFEGTIREVSRMDEAELDEEFFTGYFGEGVVSSKEEAIEELKSGIRQYYEVRSNALLMRTFQERLLDDNNFELPDKFLKRWIHFSNEGKVSEAQIEEEYTPFAENLRWTLLRDKIKEMYELEVTDEEIHHALTLRVRSYFKMDLPEHIISGTLERMLKDEKVVEDTKRDLETDKIFAAILEQVSVIDKPVTSEEFHKQLDEITKKAEAEQEEGVGLLQEEV